MGTTGQGVLLQELRQGLIGLEPTLSSILVNAVLQTHIQHFAGAENHGEAVIHGSEVHDGDLHMITKKEQKADKEWTTAHIWVKPEVFRQAYGYFESRYKICAANGINNAFWLMTSADMTADYTQNFEIDINEVLADGTGKGPAQQSKIFIGFILRHHTGGLTELGNDLLVVIDKATENLGNIAALPAQVASDFADFLIDHGITSFF